MAPDSHSGCQTFTTGGSAETSLVVMDPFFTNVFVTGDIKDNYNSLERFLSPLRGYLPGPVQGYCVSFQLSIPAWLSSGLECHKLWPTKWLRQQTKMEFRRECRVSALRLVTVNFVPLLYSLLLTPYGLLRNACITKLFSVHLLTMWPCSPSSPVFLPCQDHQGVNGSPVLRCLSCLVWIAAHRNRVISGHCTSWAGPGHALKPITCWMRCEQMPGKRGDVWMINFKTIQTGPDGVFICHYYRCFSMENLGW